MALSGFSSLAIKRPPPVRPGARIGVAALSGPVDPGRLAAGVAALSSLGFVPVLAENLVDSNRVDPEPLDPARGVSRAAGLPASRGGLFAGDDPARLAAFHALASDPELEAIFFARGGHGVLRLLPAIDWQLLARRPRAYVGYSDLTPFLLQVVARLGFAAFHGPMVAADLARGLLPEEEDGLLRALAGETLELELDGTSASGALEGPLLGGCLAMLTATLGTPFAPDFTGALVVLEEIDEPLYRLDRMLTHLRLSDTLAPARALIFGHRAALSEGTLVRGSWRKLIEEVGVDFDGPLAWGLRSGHVAPNLTLPLGMRARLEADRPRLLVPAG